MEIKKKYKKNSKKLKKGLDFFYFFLPIYIRYKRIKFLMVLQNLCLLYLPVISVFDLRTGRIPNYITLFFFALMLVVDIFTFPSKIPIRLLCAAFFFLLFLCIAMFTKGLGMGDVKLAAVIGYYKGFFAASLIFILACLGGILFFLFCHFHKRELKKIPFAPFVTIGYLISEIFCRRIL